eukprot:Ihof_evm2s681 gene=Ihof_evmTU2s681
MDLDPKLHLVSTTQPRLSLDEVIGREWGGGEQLLKDADYLVKERLRHQYAKLSQQEKNQKLREYGAFLLTKVENILRYNTGGIVFDKMGSKDNFNLEAKSHLEEVQNSINANQTAIVNLSGGKLYKLVKELHEYVEISLLELEKEKNSIMDEIEEAKIKERMATEKYIKMIQEERRLLRNVVELQDEAHDIKTKNWEEQLINLTTKKKQIANEYKALEVSLNKKRRQESPNTPLNSLMSLRLEIVENEELDKKKREEEKEAMDFYLKNELEFGGDDKRTKQSEQWCDTVVQQRSTITMKLAELKRRVAELDSELESQLVPDSVQEGERKVGALIEQDKIVTEKIYDINRVIKNNEQRLAEIDTEELPVVRRVLNLENEANKEHVVHLRQEIINQSAIQMHLLTRLVHQYDLVLKGNARHWKDEMAAWSKYCFTPSPTSLPINPASCETEPITECSVTLNEPILSMPDSPAVCSKMRDGDWVKVKCQHCHMLLYGMVILGKLAGNVSYLIPCNCEFPRNLWGCLNDTAIIDVIGLLPLGTIMPPQFRELADVLDNEAVAMLKLIEVEKELDKAN